MDEKLRPDEKDSIVAVLNMLPFVVWDRASFSILPRLGQDKRREFWLMVYGWIDREDAYKDFIVMDFVLKKGIIEANILTTSSAKYSEEAVKIIYGEDRKHNACFRIENLNGIERCVKHKLEVSK